MSKLVISDADIAAAAVRIGCTENAVRAVAEVESHGTGFLPSGLPTILYEAHLFGRLTQNKFSEAVDRRGLALSAPNWNRSFYGEGGEYQHERLEQAAALDRDAAYQACSWGAFQVLGLNWRFLNYTTLDAFLEAQRSPAGQMDAFVRFVMANRLQKALKTLDWTHFAVRYNGPDYARNAYHTKMAAAYSRLQGGTGNAA